MALNTAHFLAASRTATASTTDLVDFETFLNALCDYWRTYSDGDDDEAQEAVVDALENWGPSRTAWLTELERFTVRVELELLAALELDQLPPQLEKRVLALEVVDGMLATIDNFFASVDRPSTRNDMVYAMAVLMNPQIGGGIVADGALDFQAAYRLRREPVGTNRPVAFHRPGRAAEELEAGVPEAAICRCWECSSKLRK